MVILPCSKWIYWSTLVPTPNHILEASSSIFACLISRTVIIHHKSELVLPTYSKLNGIIFFKSIPSSRSLIPSHLHHYLMYFVRHFSILPKKNKILKSSSHHNLLVIVYVQGTGPNAAGKHQTKYHFCAFGKSILECEVQVFPWEKGSEALIKQLTTEGKSNSKLK